MKLYIQHSSETAWQVSGGAAQGKRARNPTLYFEFFETQQARFSDTCQRSLVLKIFSWNRRVWGSVSFRWMNSDKGDINVIFDTIIVSLTSQ